MIGARARMRAKSLLLFLLWLGLGSARLGAASSDWKDSGYVDGNWNNSGNWSSGIPGAANVNGNSSDTASFIGTHNLTVNVDAARSVANILFNYSPGAFTLQGGALYLAFNGEIWVKPGVASTETVNSPIYMSNLSTASVSTYLINTSTNPGALLKVGGDITGRQPVNLVTTLELDGYGNGIVSGVISDGIAGGKVAVKKGDVGAGAGSSTWILSGANTYSGGTTVTSGTLLANNTAGSATGTGGVTVSAGATLGGNGRINAGNSSITINSKGRLAPGSAASSVGALTLTASSLALQGTLAVDLSGSVGDLLALTGALDLSAKTDVLEFSSLGTPTASSYTLATYTSEVGKFDSVTGLPTGYDLVYGTNALTLVAAPEPSTWLAAALVSGVMAYSNRRRLRGLVRRG